MSDEQDAGESAEQRHAPGGDTGGEAPSGADAPVKLQAELGRAEAERIALQISARSLSTARRSVGSPTLFAIVYTPLASAIYFSLGVISGHALGLTPVVFLVSALLFALTAMTYAEGASLHQERSGSTVFARYAYNELVSFVAGWAILLDYVILIAVTCYSATQYLRVFWSPLGHSAEALGLALVFILLVVLGNIRGFGWRRSRRVAMIVVADLALQGLIVVLGLVLFFNPHTLLDPIHLGSAPSWSDLIFALTVAAISFTGLESAAGLAGEVRISKGQLKRLVGTGTATVVVIYVGIALVAVTALPVHDGHTQLATRFLDDPVVGIVGQMKPHWLAETLRYVVAGLGALTLVAAANSAMLGLSAPAALDAVRADHPRRDRRRRPGRAGEPRLPRRHLRVRRAAGVHDRARLGLQAALLRGRERARLPHPAVGLLAWRQPAAAGRVRRSDLGLRLAGGDGRARPRPLRRARLDGRRHRHVRDLPPRR
jgi:hypothetical protein